MNNQRSLDALMPMIGRWKSSGHVFGENNEVVGEILGTDTYELISGIPWIAHTVDVQMPDGRVSTYELIGGAHPQGGWNMYAFDESSDQPSVMQLTANRENLLLIQGDGVRSWFSPTAGTDHMETEWQRLVDDEWIPWMTMRFDRA